jgi:hypothetical protein
METVDAADTDDEGSEFMKNGRLQMSFCVLQIYLHYTLHPSVYYHFIALKIHAKLTHYIFHGGFTYAIQNSLEPRPLLYSHVEFFKI